MKMPETIVTVSMGEIQILKSKFRGNKDVKEFVYLNDSVY